MKTSTSIHGRVAASLYFAALLGLSGLLSACSPVVKITEQAKLGNVDIAYTLGGIGAPAVVLQSGLGDGKETWTAIMVDAQKSHAVFAYDRPGYGDTSSNSGPRDACAIAAEQRQLLRAAGVKPPYLLVGHSLGGLYQYAYAKLYPQDVSGLLLIDPTHPDHWKQMQSETPAQANLIKTMRAVTFDATMRREFDAQTDCLEKLDMNTPLRLPVKILASTVFNLLESGAFEQFVRKNRVDWLRLTGAAQIEEIAGAGHYIHKDRPQAVVQAIRVLAR